MQRRLKLLAGLVLGLCGAAATAETMKLTYPQTRQQDLVEQPFGQPVADSYRWLENDVRTDQEVAGWVTAENAVTQGYLGTLGQRGWFGQRIKALLDYSGSGCRTRPGGSISIPAIRACRTRRNCSCGRGWAARRGC